jgi:alpha-beta hydrolase superfamily lysophospholipase
MQDYKKWEAKMSRAAVILIHGLGAHTERWEFLADYLVQKGFSCYAPILQGSGECSVGVKGHLDSFKINYEDILELTKQIKHEHPGQKVFLLGESLGGLLAFMLAINFKDNYAGVVLISPAFKNGMLFPLLDQLCFYPMAFFTPQGMIKLPFTAAMCTRDPQYQAKMEQDPRELRSGSAGLLFNILKEGIKAQKIAGRLELPVLFLLAGKDYLVDVAASRRVYANLMLEDKTLIEYSDMLHALSIDLGREKVFADIEKWLLRHL